MSVLSITVGAVPFESYMYNSENGKEYEVSAPNAVIPSAVLSAENLGVDLNTPEDLFVDGDSNYYIVDSKLDTLYSFDKNWKLRYTIGSDREGEEKLYMPHGISVLDGLLYIADTGNSRIAVYSAADGKYIRSISEITGDILTEDFVFKPNKLAVSPNGSIYVVAEAALEGIIEISSDGKFYGYIGSNKTTVSAFELLWRRIFTEEQLSQISKVVPLECHNIALDEDNFILTVTAASEIDSKVKRLNPSGENVLIEDSSAIEGDYLYDETPSNFVDIAGGKNGQYFILDSTKGHVFAYDETGNLLYIFGDKNTNQMGAFLDPAAICVNGSEFLILDRGAKSITVYTETEYSKLLSKALRLYDEGKYEEDYELWIEVMKYNGNFHLAYKKAGYCQYRMKNYKAAMELFSAANAKNEYSNAFAKYRQQKASDNFVFIVIGVFAVAALIAVFVTLRIKKRKKINILDAFYMPDSDEPFIKKNFKLAYHTMFRPSDNFWNIKFEKRGSVVAAAMFIILYFIVTLFDRQMRAFLFNASYGKPMNLAYQFALVALPVAMLVISNWSITTLMDGKGTMRDIFCVIGYSLLPLIMITPCVAVATRMFTLNELVYVNIIQGIAYGWSFLLIIIGIKEIHQFSWAKTFATLAITVVAAAIIIFICMLFFSLLQEIIGFGNSVYKEISMR